MSHSTRLALWRKKKTKTYRVEGRSVVADGTGELHADSIAAAADAFRERALLIAPKEVGLANNSKRVGHDSKGWILCMG